MKLVIQGLRRSGTTIFWETFRQDPRLVCFDEPFNPNLIELPEENSKHTRAELIELMKRDPRRFWKVFAPIDPSEEIHPRMSDRQREYLEFLLAASDRVVIDSTRLAFKLEALHEIDPSIFVIHLHRSPQAFATSHLRPNGSRWIDKFRLLIRSRSFFTRSTGFSNWFIEQIVGTSPSRPFGHLIKESGEDPELIYRSCALVKLMKYWAIHFERVETDGTRLFGDRFRSIPFEDFCSAPETTMRGCYEWLGLPYPSLDLTRVTPAASPYKPSDPRWKVASRIAGVAPHPHV